MKRQNFCILCIVCFAFLLSFCSGTDETITPEQEKKVVEIAQPVAERLLERLKGELTAAVKERGFGEAIEICNIEALPLTDSVRAEFPEIVALKRTSLKFRNHQNAPDTLEEAVLKKFASVEQKGQPLPEYLVEKAELNGKTEYRYYKPLKTAALCLNCHGDPANFDPNVAQKIKIYYPEDRATGYQLDQFRGVIRVSVKM